MELFERPSGGERAVLVHVAFQRQPESEEITEFSELARSAGADPVAIVTTSRSQPDPRSFIGSGKLEEIRAILERESGELVIFDPALAWEFERRRKRGEAYDELVEEFITAAQETFPGILIQLEDFGNTNAFRLLDKYRDRFCVFDDDIQGTGAVAVAGIIAAMRITGQRLSDQKILFLGAGEAGIGTADVFVAALAEEGIPADEARKLALALWHIARGEAFDSRKLFDARSLTINA